MDSYFTLLITNELNFVLYEGRSINKFKNGIIVLVLKNWKFRNIRRTSIPAASVTWPKLAKIVKKYSCKFRMYQLLFAYEETSDRINTVRCASLTHSNSKSSRPDPSLGLKMSPLNSRVLLFVFSSNCRRPTSRLDTVHERDQRLTPNQTTTSRHRLSQ